MDIYLLSRTCPISFSSKFSFASTLAIVFSERVWNLVVLCPSAKFGNTSATSNRIYHIKPNDRVLVFCSKLIFGWLLLVRHSHFFRNNKTRHSCQSPDGKDASAVLPCRWLWVWWGWFWSVQCENMASANLCGRSDPHILRVTLHKSHMWPWNWFPTQEKKRSASWTICHLNIFKL